MGRRFPKTSTGMSQDEIFKQLREAYLDEAGPLIMNRVIDTEETSALIVPDRFAVWCKKLPANARKKLSLHELRQIWELSQKERSQEGE